jgi:hypothetical protein
MRLPAPDDTPAIVQAACPIDMAADEREAHGVPPRRSTDSANRDCKLDRVANDQERRRMEKYIAEFVDRKDVVTSMEVGTNEIVDCVDIRRQPGMKRPGMESHTIQMSPGALDPKDSITEERIPRIADGTTRKAVREIRQEWAARGQTCPAGSVPIRRLTMDILRHFRTLEEFFRKDPPHIVAGPDDLHQYAISYRYVDNWGAQTALNIWAPYTGRTDEFSLSQLWVVRGTGSDLQTVEAGWQKYYDLYGDYRPRLFIYYTSDGYGNSGCYNLSCFAFIQVANNVYIGGGFTDISAHPHPSTAWEFKLRWQRDGPTGNWWLKYGNTWVGYYPSGLFDAAGLRNMSDEVEFGGEIIDRHRSGVHTSTDMGSGHFPNDGFGYAAYHRQIRYIDTKNTWGMRPTLTEYRTDADCYDIDVFNSSGSWERYFYFGGPGYNSHCA